MAANQDKTGERKHDSFGCSLNKLDLDLHVAAAGLNLFRKDAANSPPGPVMTQSSGKGFLVGLSTKDDHSRRISGKRGFHSHRLNRNDIYIRSFADDYKADLQGSFGFSLCEISAFSIAELGEGLELSKVSELRETISVPDPTLGGLSAALFAAVQNDGGASRLFIDHIATAIGLHIIETYGNGCQRANGKQKFLSPAQEKIATDLLVHRRDGNLTIEELSAACGLPQARFLSAFRQTTGKTPNQWLAAYRVEQAQDLLLHSTLPLGEISQRCGYADQSHFSRAFSSALGVPPGAWRRLRT